ncbi:uncharacterized protein [Cicer arietinum]|uniref:Uncharacterized protein LOC101514551 isoform X3 n=1 Tax=Cicer arietinum TaxID=3827 RepID=A0A3Q7YB68_CICAR|nr:uncharacterized protein LOC101514551 isoform X3 [Cicer arietinum]
MFLFLSLSIVLSSPSRSSSPLSFSTPSPPLPSCSSPPSSYPMNLVFSKPTFTFEEVDLEVFGLQIKVPFDVEPKWVRGPTRMLDLWETVMS